jgi:putative flavoprotein involved in K+ transport
MAWHLQGQGLAFLVLEAGLYLPGLSWRHTRGSALLGFVQDDAAFLADRIQTYHRTAVSVAAGVTQQPST